jgi:hypothetical protein
MVDFDEWWDWDGDQGVAGDSHTQKIPTGTHTGDVIEAFTKDLKYRATDKNPSGRCLVIKWSKQGFLPVEASAPIDWRGLIEAICAAAGLPSPQRGQPWDPSLLVGRVVTVDIDTVISAKGNEYQRVTKWHPSPQKPLPPARPAAKRAPARTPAAKAHAEFTEHADGDDIPF